MGISLIGKVISNDGSILVLQCADGGKAQVRIEPDFSARGPIIEIVGVIDDNSTSTIQAFVSREMGNDFDLDLYNKMIEKVYMNNRYKDSHRPDGVVSM